MWFWSNTIIFVFFEKINLISKKVNLIWNRMILKWKDIPKDNATEWELELANEVISIFDGSPKGRTCVWWLTLTISYKIDLSFNVGNTIGFRLLRLMLSSGNKSGMSAAFKSTNLS